MNLPFKGLQHRKAPATRLLHKNPYIAYFVRCIMIPFTNIKVLLFLFILFVFRNAYGDGWTSKLFG